LIAGLLGLALAVLTGQVAHADAFEEILKKGVVRIAVPLDVPPFGSQNEKREPEGFDVEFAGMIAKALGVKLEMQQITAGNRIPYLITNKVDIVISVMGLTPERARQIMFTSPYADTQLAVYGPKALAVSSADTLGNYKIAATKGSTMEIGLSAMNPKAQIMRTEDDATSATAYLSGQTFRSPTR
jgi:polar amino acid transport system substrate-binding protein